MAEEAAEAYLQQKGYKLLARNWRCKIGELDLIMEEDERLVIVEVRSRRSSLRYGTAIEAVDPRKCRQVRAVAGYYVMLTGRLQESLRFDVVAVTFSRSGEPDELVHLPNAF